MSGPASKKARRRNRHDSWRRVAELQDEASVRARERIQTITAKAPVPKYAAQILAHTAMQAAEKAGVPWAVAAHSLLGQLEAREAARAEAERKSQGILRRVVQGVFGRLRRQPTVH